MNNARIKRLFRLLRTASKRRAEEAAERQEYRKIEAYCKAGHTSHCAMRMVWGDGEPGDGERCECGVIDKRPAYMKTAEYADWERRRGAFILEAFRTFPVEMGTYRVKRAAWLRENPEPTESKEEGTQ